MTRRLWQGLLVLLSLALSVVAYFVYDIYRYVHAPLVLTESRVYYFPERQSAQYMISSLQRAGILTQPHYARWYLRWSGVGSRLHAGEYQLKVGTSFKQLLQQMARGEVMLRSITFVEGWTFATMLQEIRQSPHIVQLLAGLDVDDIMQQLGYAGEHPEGRFFPDSYYFHRGTSDIEILKMAYTAMQRHLQQAWAQRQTDLPYQSEYEALIVASMIEKEVQLDDERAIVAGVIVNRLRKNMRLQIDPTVIYGLGDEFQGRLSRQQLRQDTPYNTYTRHGLPPTPIAMPSLAALHAAVQPESTAYYYFVAKGDGSHQFSRNLEQQNQAIQRYLLSRTG